MPVPASSTKLSFQEKLAYGLGDTASNFYYQAANIFLANYYTDIFGLQTDSATWLLFIVPTVIAFLNPVVGLVSDRTHSRWGKFRPYLLWGAIPYGILSVLMFTRPELSDQGRLFYAYVTFALMTLAYAVVNTPYGALMGVMSASSEERTSLSSYRFACAFLGALLISWLVPNLKKFLTPTGAPPADGFRNTMAIFAVLAVGMFFYTFARTRERVDPPAGQKTSFARDLGDLFRNTPWIILFFFGFLNLANNGLRAGAGTFYFKYLVGDEAGQGTFNLVGFACFILGAISTKLFTNRFSRRSLMIGLTTCNALGIAACYFVDPHNLPLLYACNIVASFAAGPTPAIVWSFYADTADYGEWKFGRRATGLIFSATVVIQKIGLAVGTGLLTHLLGHYGYVANATQTTEAQHGIVLVFSLIPGAFALLAGFTVFFYPLDEPKVKEIERVLAARKGAPSAVPAAS
ncbi:MAG TPA: MFS transporter [Candidatus Didemnitutus sp.]|nr:MFS transporter [Candidatus Didemnitutus sp.]